MMVKKDALTGSADALFGSGRFEEAKTRYAAMLGKDREHRHAIIRLATIALLENRLTDAETWSVQALELDRRTMVSRLGLSRFGRVLRGSREIKPEELLGQALYLRGDYPRAAPLVRAAGERARAKKLESFGDTKPYQITSLE